MAFMPSWPASGWSRCSPKPSLSGTSEAQAVIASAGGRSLTKRNAGSVCPSSHTEVAIFPDTCLSITNFVGEAHRGRGGEHQEGIAHLRSRQEEGWKAE